MQNVFNEVDSYAILPILVSVLGNPDKLVWRGTPSGIFSVKSAYHMYMETRGVTGLVRSCFVQILRPNQYTLVLYFQELIPDWIPS